MARSSSVIAYVYNRLFLRNVNVGGYDCDERGIFMKNSVIEHKPTDFYDVPRGVWRCRAFCFIKDLVNDYLYRRRQTLLL